MFNFSPWRKKCDLISLCLSVAPYLLNWFKCGFLNKMLGHRSGSFDNLISSLRATNTRPRLGDYWDYWVIFLLKDFFCNKCHIKYITFITKKILLSIDVFYLTFGGTGTQKVTEKRLGSIPTRGNEIFTFIFSFLRSGIEAKRGVEFRHSTCNAFSPRLKVGNGCLNIS